MPSHCCVPSCRGNYDSTVKSSVFKFPEDPELRAKWIRAIPRKDFQPSKYSRVCGQHFHEEDIERETKGYDEKSGHIISVQLKIPRLVKNAVPQIFPNCPSYLSSTTSRRCSPNKKELVRECKAVEKALRKSKIEKDQYDKKYTFCKLKELDEKISLIDLPEKWTVIKSGEYILFSLILFNPAPAIAASVMVNEALHLTVSIKNTVLTKINKKVLSTKIDNINELSSIINGVNLLCEPQTSDDVSNSLLSVHYLLCAIKENVEDEIKSALQFIIEQIGLLSTKKESHRYTPDFLIFSSLLFSISPHAYRYLMSSSNFILPHPSTIRRLCSTHRLNPKFEQFENGFLNYIKCKFLLLNDCDKMVILMMDEIHLKPYFDFKGGNILGASHDSSSAATSAYVFMLQSILSPYKDVVHILPVSKFTSEDLFMFLKKLIIYLENIGFMVIAIVSDNCSINRSAMSYFAFPPKLSIVYPNPVNNKRPLFFCIDSVHLLKNVRNNWLNQKNAGKCFFYPDFDGFNDEKLYTSSFDTLRKMHQMECGENSQLLKYGYGLTMKALNPSNIERQNVKLALKIFNRYIYTGLLELGKKHNLPNCESTASFINIICTWFEIMNVKTPYKGKRFNNVYQEPIFPAKNDHREIFLQKFLNWLDNWKLKNLSTGKFSKETHAALAQTTHAILEMSRYCFEELNFKYFLPGKLQTDKLEERFGKYRQLSGSQYNISVTQIFETECKLRIQDYLPLTINSSKFGRIEIDALDVDEEISETDEHVEELQFISVTEDDIKKLEIMPIITYLAGVCLYKYLKKVKCDFCRNNLSLDKGLSLENSYSFIKHIDRGELLYPHPYIIKAVSFNYIIIQKLISKDYEDLFLKLNKQRTFVNHVTYQTLIHGEFIFFDECSEGHSVESVLKSILATSTNTLLKNYCATKNDEYVQAKLSNRKLQILKK